MGPTKRRVVVGVDGSDESGAAFAQAVREARSLGAVVEVVSAFPAPLPVPPPLGRAPASFEDVERDAIDVADRTVAAARDAGIDLTGVEVEIRALPGSPAVVLLDTAEGAQILVLGARGRGGFAGLLLGSVSQQCVQHAPCPVLIVRRGVAETDRT
jgi:nucleotide-binding universal stress UspA family protein